MFSLTALVDGTAVIRGVTVHRHNLTLLAGRTRLRTGRAHCRNTHFIYHTGDFNKLLMIHWQLDVTQKFSSWWDWLQMLARQQLLLALVTIRVWSSLQEGTSDSQSSGSHSVKHTYRDTKGIVPLWWKYIYSLSFQDINGVRACLLNMRLQPELA